VGARRIFALLMALLIWSEGAGVARALSADATVDCCCGTHSATRRCKCLHCPVGLRNNSPAKQTLAAPSSCTAHSSDEMLLVIATLPPGAPALAAPDFSPLASDPALEPEGALARATRPPP
jgi:hypothetical protein